MPSKHLHVSLTPARYHALGVMAHRCGYTSLARFVAVLVGMMLDLQYTPQEDREYIAEMFTHLEDWQRDGRDVFPPSIRKRL